MRGIGNVVLACLLVGCSSEPHHAPVEERRPGRAEAVDKSVATAPRHYSVARGDTLYAIAWRYGFDYRELARANNVPAPYRIYPGQTLILSDSVAVDTAAQPRPKTAVAKVGKKVATARKSAAKPKAVAQKSIGWRWPTSGKVVRGFSGTVHKGIDIDGQAGDKVMAVAAGTVVYAGSGIVGYGKLLIVKHSEEYLSAYGHNRRLLVQEGDVVRQGQRIAEKGSSATNAVKLHFEIRREGKPVDPTTLLARR